MILKFNTYQNSQMSELTQINLIDETSNEYDYFLDDIPLLSIISNHYNMNVVEKIQNIYKQYSTHEKCIRIFNYILYKFKETINDYKIEIENIFLYIYENNYYDDNDLINYLIKNLEKNNNLTSSKLKYILKRLNKTSCYHESSLFLCYKTIDILRLIFNNNNFYNYLELEQFITKFQEFNKSNENNIDHHLINLNEDQKKRFKQAIPDNKDYKKYNILRRIFNVFIFIRKIVFNNVNKTITIKFYFNLAIAIVEGENKYITGGGATSETLLRLQVYYRFIENYDPSFTGIVKKRKIKVCKNNLVKKNKIIENKLNEYDDETKELVLWMASNSNKNLT
jgi:hypothetical protein